MTQFYQRHLKLPELLSKKSFFLFGPRSTGKSTLIDLQLPESSVYDLLDAATYQKLLKDPKVIEQENPSESPLIVIDEIQKLPSLLDEVHRLIQKKGFRFLLTGSSARKLRQKGVNLLAGRAWESQLFGLTSVEIPNFDLIQYINRGGLPHIYDSSDYEEELDAYIHTYLREEIRAEALTRNIKAFSEFLDLIALSNGQEINYASLASDAQVSADTLRNYLQVLEDTLISFSLKGFIKTKRRKSISRAKVYFFDLGLTRRLRNSGLISANSPEFVGAFEHFIILEVRAYNSYFRKKETLGYWRSTSQFEVDLIIGDHTAIEIKSSQQVTDRHLKGLRALMEEKILKRFIVVSRDEKLRKTEDGIEITPWPQFLEKLWQGDYF